MARTPARLPAAVSWPGTALVLLLLATVTLHYRSLGAPFYGDDYWFLDQVRDRPLLPTLTAPDPLGNYFRPLSRQVYFWVLSRMGDESPLPFHIANLALWLAALSLLFALIRRLAGARAAAIGTAFLALHQAADVPMLWASDAQDLMAITGALATLLLYTGGRRVGAAVALLFAVFSKEVAVVVPAIAVLMERHPGEPWRVALKRAWPLGISLALWASIWILHQAGPAPGREPLTLGFVAAIAALAHGIQTFVGLEWGAAGVAMPTRLPTLVLSIALALVAVFLSVRAVPAREDGAQGAPTEKERRRAAAAEDRARAAAAEKERRRAIGIGLAWALLGALPVAAAIKFWSGYSYLFALAGAALALGAWLAGRRRAWAAAALVVLALASASSGALEEFAYEYEPWTTVSHINRYSLTRGMRYLERYLGMLRAARPTLPANSTLFFSGIPKGVPFQQGDGPIVRWAYRDSSLRSHFASGYSRALALRGPTFFFQVEKDSLLELPEVPDFYRSMALTMLLNGAEASARDALLTDLDRHPEQRQTCYWLGMVEWQLGQRDSAIAVLARAEIPAHGAPTPEIDAALKKLAARDTVAAVTIMIVGVTSHVLDPRAHGLLADLTLSNPSVRPIGTLEAFAARALAPEDPWSWRRWGVAQLLWQRHDQAAASLQRYLDMGGRAAQADSEVQRTMVKLRSVLPGGEAARAALRGKVAGRR